MNDILAAIALSLWTLITPAAARSGDAARIAAAIAQAVAEEPAPTFGSHAEDAAVLAFYAWKESNLQNAAVGDAGHSCGPWQMPCAMVGRGLSLTDQARTWMRWVRESSLGSVDSSPQRAAHRLGRARELLGRVLTSSSGAAGSESMAGSAAER